MLAAVGAGIYSDATSAAAAMTRTGERLAPHAAASAIYRELYPIYCELYPALRASFVRLHAQTSTTERK